jgi:hypothetical protein
VSNVLEVQVEPLPVLEKTWGLCLMQSDITKEAAKLTCFTSTIHLPPVATTKSKTSIKNTRNVVGTALSGEQWVVVWVGT